MMDPNARIAAIFAATPELASREYTPRPFELTEQEQAYLDRQRSEYSRAFVLDNYHRAWFHREVLHALFKWAACDAHRSEWINRLWDESEDEDHLARPAESYVPGVVA